jgi:hypothetical protein
MKKVSGPQVVTTVDASELPLPAEIQEALGEFVGAARDGLLALLGTRHSRSKQLGLKVMHCLQARPGLARLMGLDHEAPAVAQPDP